MRLFKTSISKRVIGLFILMVVLMSVLVTVSQSIALQQLNAQNKNYYSNLVSVISRQINGKLNSLEKLSMSLAMDSEIVSVNQSSITTNTSLWRYRDVLQTAELYSSGFDIKNTINIYLNARDRVISSDGRFSEIGEYNSMEPYIESGLERSWFYRQKHRSAYCSGCNDAEHLTDVITFCFTDTFHGKDGVCIGIDIEKSELMKYITNVNFLGDGIVFMANDRNELIFSNGMGPDGFEKVYGEINSRRKTGTASHSFFSRDPWQVAYSGDDGPMLVGVIFTSDQGEAPIRIVLFSLILCITAVFVMAVVFVFVSNKRMFRPFGNLVQAMQRVKDGDLSVRIYNEPENEMGFVYKQFNEMTERIDHLINQVYLQDLRSTKAELELLQSHINPHFLFNCLNFIYQMSMAGRQKPVSDMAIYLSRYFRYSVHQGEDLIPLVQELENIDTYMQICMMQYPNRVEYENLVNSVYDSLLIPRLSVQTLAENAFIHGLKNNMEKGRIFIEVQEDETSLYIRVCNDHSELSQVRTDEINDAICQDESQTIGYGLNNTQKRFKLHFGAQSGILMKLDNGITVAEIRIPVETARFKDDEADEQKGS